MSKYLPPRQKSAFEVGERVVGKFRPVKIKNEKGIKVLWRSENETVSETVKLSDCAENVQADLMQVIKTKYEGEFQISFSTDKSSIVNFHPASGQFRVKVNNFPSPENEDPKPKVYTGKFGDMIKFNVVLEIVNPKEVKGLTLPMQLFYEKFVPMIVDESNEQFTGFASPPGNSKHCDMLSDFCDATGLWEFGAIEWSDNILPELEKRILRLEREFNVVINGGWVEHIYEIADNNPVVS